MSDRFNDIDLMITEDGDLAIDENDLITVQDLDYVLQTLTSRIKSVAKDWFYDNVGADLESAIGKPNTREIADDITNKITIALTKDRFCEPDDVLVMATPVASYTLVIGIFISVPFQPEPLGLSVELNFLTGFKINRIS